METAEQPKPASMFLSKKPLSSEEMIKLVDEHNEEMGSVKRSYVNKMMLWHRASYIFLRGTDKQFLIQKRTMLKGYCPGYFELTTGGVVSAGEDDDESATRELHEELGVDLDLKQHKLGTFKFEDAKNHIWCNLYFVDDFKGNLTLQESEVEAV